MTTVIGLFWQDKDVQDLIRRLEQAGLARDSIATPTHITWQSLTAEAGHPIVRYATWGAVISIAIYAVFGLAAGAAGCTYCGYNTTFAVATPVGFVAVGGLVGALLGQWVGKDAQEKDTHLFTQGVNQGGRLVTVQAGDDQLATVMAYLREGNPVGVTVLAD
jgi:hypothetical protein